MARKKGPLVNLGMEVEGSQEFASCSVLECNSLFLMKFLSTGEVTPYCMKSVHYSR